MTYQELENKILQLQEDGLNLFSIGKSVLNKEIWATHIGQDTGTQILLQGGIHAREYITSLLLVEMARDLYLNNSVKNGGIYFVFLTNPDGAEIVLDGIENLPCEITKNYLLSANNDSYDFKNYKANINLVDLNTNFDALWGKGAKNVFCPSTENFVGFFPNSEREVNNLINFTLQVQPKLTISYHTKGNVIYYGFEGESEQDLTRDLEIGTSLSEYTNYPLILTENSTGGYKDWCIQKLKIPSYTIEVGAEDIPHPIGEEYLPEIFLRNKDVPLIALEKAKEYSKQIDIINPKVQNITKEKQNESNVHGYLARITSKAKARSSNRRSNC